MVVDHSIQARALILDGLCLFACRDKARSPTVMLVTSTDIVRILHSLPELNDMACAEMSRMEDDFENFPALGWQTHVVKGCVRQMLASKDWLRMRLAASRYAHLPLASIRDDWVIDTCDALFSRHLIDAGQLLWTRDGGQPDLSCSPIDIANELVTGEQGQQVRLAWPGVYRSVCLEIQVSHLAVNAVLEAATLSELEGSVLLDDQTGRGPAFRILKSLAQTWIEDAAKRNNV